MYSHPVSRHWKNEGLLQRAAHVFSGAPGSKDGGERVKALIERFLLKGKIFADEPTIEQGTAVPTKVTIDLKEIKVPTRFEGRGANRRPLTLIKLNGVALLLLRPDPEKEEGVIFKLCPHEKVALTIGEFFDQEIDKFNRSVPVSLMQEVALDKAS